MSDANPKLTRLARRVLRNAIADYMESEGCGCCSDPIAHVIAKENLAKLLRVPKYGDGSGYDFARYKTKKKSIRRERKAKR